MKVLLTGANGYIGMRLLPVLLDQGHEVVCLVRDARRFPTSRFLEGDYEGSKLEIIEGDLLDRDSLSGIPEDIEIAFYLVHSMGSGAKNFYDLEDLSARNFLSALESTKARQVIYLSGIVNHPKESLSPHLASRLNVEEILLRGAVPATVLRAAIIVGAGSASFEIIRDLVEKLPVMIAPKWLRNPCQPIAVRNVIDYLTGVIGNERTFDGTFNIAGPKAYSYQDLLMQFAEVRGLGRVLLPVPLITPKLSSYWLFFMTNASYPLARSLVDSLTYDMSSSENRIREIVDLDLISYPDAVKRAFSMIEQNQVKSSWIDSLSSGRMDVHLLRRIEVPRFGVYSDQRVLPFNRDPEEVAENIWRIGGKEGWYSMDWAWKLRGWMDRIVGGSGLRRGRRHPSELNPGDALDFWRVLVSDREKRRLILYAEMKLPGDAWLEFQIEPNRNPSINKAWRVVQTATFRPRGLLGRLYWLAVLPFHHFVFTQMVNEIAGRRREEESTLSGQ
ncbi:MAG: SDR family oxidoreductase [Verrucomicrobiales bacterium]|nr:SDR family oxidoreductase [Verrucomicrobiales bacterium]